jgi:hypothetical protein
MNLYQGRKVGRWRDYFHQTTCPKIPDEKIIGRLGDDSGAHERVVKQRQMGRQASFATPPDNTQGNFGFPRGDAFHVIFDGHRCTFM